MTVVGRALGQLKTKEFRTELESAAASQLQSNLIFDRQLREKLQVYTTEEAQARYLFQRKYLSPLKNVVIFVYYFVVPMVEPPAWCVSAYPAVRKNWLVYDCQQVQGMPYSNMVKLAPWLVGLTDLSCLAFLCYFQYYKSTWKSLTPRRQRRLYISLAILAVTFVDVVVSCIRHQFAYIDQLMKPIVVLFTLSQQRVQFQNIFLNVLRDAGAVIVSIFVFIGFFAVLGQFIFRLSLENFIYFNRYDDSFYQMLICLTTANFPDVMLPAYDKSRASSLFFIVFLVLGLFFLQSILLAIVFDNYKRYL